MIWINNTKNNRASSDLMDKIIIGLWCQLHWAIHQENLNVHCWMIFCPGGIIPDSGLTGPNNIRIYCHPQIDYFVVSQLFSVARPARLLQAEIATLLMLTSVGYLTLRTIIIISIREGIFQVNYGNKFDIMKKIEKQSISKLIGNWKKRLLVEQLWVFL